MLKQKSIYMVGAGRRFMGARFGASLGIIDNMTIIQSEAAASAPVYDPTTGVSYPSKGINHNNRIGYMFDVSYPIWIKRPSRNSKTGWSISPMASYADNFSKADLGGILTLGASVDLWFD